jgi:DNA-directed RNA polymerase
MEKEEEAAGDTDIAKEQQRLRKKVTDLMKKQKLRQVRNIVKNQDNSRPWGQDVQAKV